MLAIINVAYYTFVIIGGYAVCLTAIRIGKKTIRIIIRLIKSRNKDK